MLESEKNAISLLNGIEVDLPVIRSAGVDLEFGNDDDIVSIRIIDGNGIFAQ